MSRKYFVQLAKISQAHLVISSVFDYRTAPGGFSEPFAQSTPWTVFRYAPPEDSQMCFAPHSVSSQGLPERFARRSQQKPRSDSRNHPPASGGSLIGKLRN